MAEIICAKSTDEVDFDAIEDNIIQQKHNRERMQSENKMRANTHADSGSDHSSDTEDGSIVPARKPVHEDDEDLGFSMIDGKFVYEHQPSQDVIDEMERMDTINARRSRRHRRRVPHYEDETCDAEDEYGQYGQELQDGDWGDLDEEGSWWELPHNRVHDRTGMNDSESKPWWESDRRDWNAWKKHKTEQSGKSGKSGKFGKSKHGAEHWLKKIYLKLKDIESAQESLDTNLDLLVSRVDVMSEAIDVIDENILEIKTKTRNL